jgi:DNA/RNA endonuclease YhcR with UshA esterase domain
LPAWTDGLDSLAGKRLGVRGAIVSYRGRLEIVLREPGQLVHRPKGGT